MATGTVKWFNDTNGYGFITPDEGTKDLFVHHSNIAGEGFKSLAEAEDAEARRAELIADYKERFANPYTAAERGYVDEVIEPRRPRPVLIDALETALTKREPRPKRKHGNIPL